MKNIFQKWLQKNKNRFNYKPFVIKENEYQFKGINKNITLKISFEPLDVMINFYLNNEWFDSIQIEYIGDLQHSKKGYFDNDLKSPIFYKTYEELAIKQVFEKIIEFCNTNFKKENNLYLVDFGGIKEGVIANEYNKYKKFVVKKVKIII